MPILGIRVYIAMGLVLTFLAMGVAVKVQTSRLHAVEAKYQGFVAQTKAEGEAQAKLNQETVAKQKGATASVTKDYRSALTELMRLRDERAHPGTVSESPRGPEGTPAPAPEYGPDCPVAGATEDALKLYYLQEWARQQGFPLK